MSTDRSADARNAKVDLGGVIDHVAAAMVAVPDDPEMVTRIVSTLPDRSSRRGWLIPQFAALSAIVIAVLIWSAREPSRAPTVLPVIEMAAVTSFPGVVTAREPGIPREPGTSREPGTLVTQPSKPPEPPEPSEPWQRSDFDRSLPPLLMTELKPVELPASPALVLTSIDVAALPLTAESFSPR
jgi:hypothetical protein